MTEKTVRIEADGNINDVINELNHLAKEGRFVFRGYNKQDELLPSIIRNKTSYVDVEDKLLEEFEKYGSHYFHANTPIDFMSYAQHFGLPTRLLDFTYNPFIALSFAIHGQKSNGNYTCEDDKQYYYIRYASLDENICVPRITLREDIYNSTFTRTDSLAKRACQTIDSVTDLFGKNHLNRNVLSLDLPEIGIDSINLEQRKIREQVIFFVDPAQSNQRIIMQQGLFMFPYTLEKEEHLRIIRNNTSLIMIHKELREKLMEYLDTLGFNSFRLMPDLSSICYAVKKRIIDERQQKSGTFKKKNSTVKMH